MSVAPVASGRMNSDRREAWRRMPSIGRLEFFALCSFRLAFLGVCTFVPRRNEDLPSALAFDSHIGLTRAGISVS